MRTTFKNQNCVQKVLYLNRKKHLNEIQFIPVGIKAILKNQSQARIVFTGGFDQM